LLRNTHIFHGPLLRRYGDVYLAKWHNCEVAVKCLNPSLFFNGGDLSSVTRAAIVDLVKEADMLGSLRRVVLPPPPLLPLLGICTSLYV
jgi:hypothetical protein